MARWSAAAGYADRLTRRNVIVVVTAIVCGLYSTYSGRHVRPDFDQFYGAALALRNGLRPYDAVGPDRWFDLGFSFFYPLPAAVLALPFTLVPVEAARAAFCGLCGGVFALALTFDGRLFRTPALLSFSMLAAVQYGQLSPLLAAGLVYPWLGGMVAVKPTVGAAVVAGQTRRRDVAVALGVGATLTFVSVLVDPRWPIRWMSIAGGTIARPTIFVPGGALLLLAVFRWRQPQARWLFVFSLVPVTSPMYESLPMFMGIRTFRQSLLLALLTHAARWVEALLSPYPDGTFAEWIRASAVCTVCIVYLPALWWILRDE
jgi:hypothetical protein